MTTSLREGGIEGGIEKLFTRRRAAAQRPPASMLCNSIAHKNYSRLRGFDKVYGRQDLPAGYSTSADDDALSAVAKIGGTSEWPVVGFLWTKKISIGRKEGRRSERASESFLLFSRERRL